VRTATWLIETGVGLACLALAWGLLGWSRWRWLALGLSIAGAAAIAHAVGALAGAWG